MKPLIVNLKTLYQCRIMWLFHIVSISGILVMWAAIYKLDTADPPSIAIPLLLICCYGGAIGFLVADIISKPFAFYLPGQMMAVQKFVFIIWLSIIAIITLTMAALFFTTIKINPAHFFGSIGLMSLSYWSGLTIIISKRGSIATSIFFLLFLMTAFSITSGMKIIEPILTAYPWIVTFMSGFLSYLIYRAVGRKENSRHLCAIAWPGFSVYNKKKANRLKAEFIRMNQGQRLDQVADLTGNFFYNRIKSNRYSMLLTNLWGQVYLILGPVITYRRRELWTGLIICFIGGCILKKMLYSPDQTFFIFPLSVFILASIACGIIFDYQRFNIFLPIGRKEYFWRGLVYLFTVILMVLGYMAISVLIFNLLTGKLTSNAWALLVVPIIMLPLFGGLVILIRETMVIIISLVIMFFIAVAISYKTVIVMENAPFIIDLLIILSAMAITWGFHLAVLYYDRMKRSLC